MTTAPQLPPTMARLPRDKHGRPVPYFVAWPDGTPDFRIMRAEALTDAIRFELCWVCGTRRGRYGTFVIGPMCAVNRTSAEPPSHYACAAYSGAACPFMTTPHMRRRDTGLDELDTTDPAGHMITRNPGVTLLWTSRTHRPYRAPDGSGVLFDIGDPVDVEWLTAGRPSTRTEVLASIDSGLPTLETMAEEEGPDAVAHLRAMHADALRLVPAEELPA